MDQIFESQVYTTPYHSIKLRKNLNRDLKLKSKNLFKKVRNNIKNTILSF